MSGLSATSYAFPILGVMGRYTGAVVVLVAVAAVAAVAEEGAAAMLGGRGGNKRRRKEDKRKQKGVAARACAYIHTYSMIHCMYSLRVPIVNTARASTSRVYTVQ